MPAVSASIRRSAARQSSFIQAFGELGQAGDGCIRSGANLSQAGPGKSGGMRRACVPVRGPEQHRSV